MINVKEVSLIFKRDFVEFFDKFAPTLSSELKECDFFPDGKEIEISCPTRFIFDNLGRAQKLKDLNNFAVRVFNRVVRLTIIE